MKKLISLVLALALTLSLSSFALAAEKIRVGASPSPHAEILAAAKDALLEKGYDLEVVEFTDYILPNTTTESGELDANYFQHKPYLADFNAQNGTHLVSAFGVHVEPMAVFAGKGETLETLKDGATIAVPNDPTNEARALLLLEKQGVLTLKEEAGITATKLDIEENPHNVNILEVEAAQLPLMLPDVEFAVINGNYALAAGLNPVNDSVAIEDGSSPYLNVVVVKEGNENADFVLALKEVLQSDAIKTFIDETYKGSVIAAF